MKESAYKQAGVDIDAGAELVERIKAPVKKTFRPGVLSGLGGFGGLFDLSQAGYENPILVSATDGVGTKLRVAIETGIYNTVGQDLVAMCVNDLVTSGAEPLLFLDYFACGHLDVGKAENVIKGIAAGCELAGCALIGGETAEMPGMYAKEDFDLAGFSVGAMDESHILKNETIQPGDIIIGLPSSGVHSNGYSLVRKIVSAAGLDYSSKAPFDNSRSLGEALLAPTEIYIKSLMPLLRGHDQPVLKALAHITGGGLTENIPRVLPDGLSAELNASSWPYLPVFSWLQGEANLSDQDMAVTFNCGIGMVMIMAPNKLETVSKAMTENNQPYYEIGHITESSKSSVIINNAKGHWA